MNITRGYVSIRCWVYGRVQGVGFRYSTQHQANILGLKGHARNLDDGSVEVLIVGEQAQVEALLEWLKAGGPCSASVEHVRVEPRQPDPTLSDFSIG